MTSSTVTALRDPAGGLPDINAETYPFELVQQLLDRAAYFVLYSMPVETLCAPITDPRRSDAIIGVQVTEALHRFQILSEQPSRERGLRAATQVGEKVGEFTHKWMFIPGDYRALPGRAAPAQALGSSDAQRFVMLESRFVSADGADSFDGFGTGSTLSGGAAGNSGIPVAAVGTILEGRGRFRGCQGTYTYCGVLSPQNGFRGCLMLRVVDPQGTFVSRTALPTPSAIPDPEPGITYLVLRGQKKNREQKSAYRLAPSGEMQGLDVTQQLRLQHMDAAITRNGLRTSAIVGSVVGEMSARIDFNLLKPGAPGTSLSPIPFKSYNRYTIVAPDGSTTGSFDADGNEGRTFLLTLENAPGQMALRFGGFGPILNGQGQFEGVTGIMTDNSVVGVSPHAIVTSYILRLNDPDGRFRARFEF
jgi:hypothetical protein